MTEREIYMKLFDVSINTYYLWKKQGRSVFTLLEKYFTKEDLEEFIFSEKISRYEGKDSKKIDDYIRISEIIKLLTKYKADTLSIALSESLESCGIISATSKRLKDFIHKDSFLKELEKILRDLDSEKSYNKDKGKSLPKNIELEINEKENFRLIKNNADKTSFKETHTFQSIVNDFNDKIGFDFNENDHWIIWKIISRYKVYNTLYDLDS
ncbi:MAG: hypothetical protein WC253_06185 [Sulfurovaceae bacterium]|jgi:hypothetical protein|nr:hypothetical protein [Sulfurovaceae bacterium]